MSLRLASHDAAKMRGSLPEIRILCFFDAGMTGISCCFVLHEHSGMCVLTFEVCNADPSLCMFSAAKGNGRPSMMLMVSFVVYFMIAKVEHGYQNLHAGCVNGEVNRIAAQR